MIYGSKGVDVEGLWLPGQPKSIGKPGGQIIIGGQVIADTIQCVHCNCHWVPVQGSGKVRGFCNGCMGPVCGQQKCIPCIPWEKKLDRNDKWRKKYSS